MQGSAVNVITHSRVPRQGSCLGQMKPHGGYLTGIGYACVVEVWGCDCSVQVFPLFNCKNSLLRCSFAPRPIRACETALGNYITIHVTNGGTLLLP